MPFRPAGRARVMGGVSCAACRGGAVSRIAVSSTWYMIGRRSCLQISTHFHFGGGKLCPIKPRSGLPRACPVSPAPSVLPRSCNDLNHCLPDLWRKIGRERQSSKRRKLQFTQIAHRPAGRQEAMPRSHANCAPLFSMLHFDMARGNSHTRRPRDTDFRHAIDMRPLPN